MKNGPPPEFKEFQLVGLDEFAPASTTVEFVFQPLTGSPGGGGNPEEKAQRLLAEAQERVQHIERQAYEQGFQQGQKDGLEVGERSLEHQVQQFRQLILDMQRQKEAVFLSRCHDLTELVLIICRKLLARELSLSPEAIADIVSQGFRHLADTEEIKLRLNPQDCEILQQSSRDSWPAGVELVADGTITAGGFMLETPTGDINGTLENRWEVVSQAVRDAIQAADEWTLDDWTPTD